MHELDSLRAEAVTEPPGPRRVCLFQAALWGPACGLKTALRRMRPAFAVGGFPLPPFRRHRMLAIDAGMALPPAGGYVEEIGRSLLVDGCSASTLVAPPGPGDPSVGHLHIVPNTIGPEQRHPGESIGMAVRGRGLAHRRTGPPLALYPGRAWRIPAGERHWFETRAEALDILVFHQDPARTPSAEAWRVPAAAPAQPPASGPERAPHGAYIDFLTDGRPTEPPRSPGTCPAPSGPFSRADHDGGGGTSAVK